MDIGMLWFDNDPQSDLKSKVMRAADYYREKYGGVPNLCFVHPGMLTEETITTGEITVCSKSTMLQHHFWIGVQQHNISSS